MWIFCDFKEINVETFGSAHHLSNALVRSLGYNIQHPHTICYVCVGQVYLMVIVRVCLQTKLYTCSYSSLASKCRAYVVCSNWEVIGNQVRKCYFIGTKQKWMIVIKFWGTISVNTASSIHEMKKNKINCQDTYCSMKTHAIKTSLKIDCICTTEVCVNQVRHHISVNTSMNLFIGHLHVLECD